MSREGRSKWNGVFLLLFVFASVFLLCGVVWYQRESSIPHLRTRTPHRSQATIASRNLSLTAVHDHGYLLELNSSDAMTGGAMNVMSIQCMASKLSPKLIVVEPFAMNSIFGAFLEVENRESFDRENSVKLSDIYDINAWNKASDHYHYNRLAPWESFIDDAPRNVILVENQWWDNCNLSALIEKFSGFFKTFNFRIVKTVCLNFKKSGAMYAGQFKGIVYGKYAPEQVTVIIDRLPGIGGVGPWNTAVEGRSCGKKQYYGLILDMPTSKRIKRDAEEYIKRYLGGKKDFVSLMIRFEHRVNAPTESSKVVQAKQILQECYQKLTAVKSRQKISATFLTLDVGKYGSSGFFLGKHGPIEGIVAEIHKFFDSLYKGSISYSEWEDSFVEVSGVKFGHGVSGYVAVLQKEIAIQGQCIILVGGGSFQESAGKLHQLAHQEQKQC